MKQHILLTAIAALIIALSPLQADAAGARKVDIAASPAGGTWYVGLGAYAKVLSAMHPEYDTTLFPGGGVGNIVRVSQGKSLLGITAVAFMKSAIAGTDPYRAPQNVKALANLDDMTRTIFVVPADSPLRTVRDVVESRKPLRISTSKVGGNGEIFLRFIIQALGSSRKQLQERGFTIYGVTPTKSANMLREGQLDVMTVTSPGEHFAVSELMRNMEVRFLPYDEKLLSDLQKDFGMEPGVLPNTFYKPCIKEDIPVITSPSGLVINADVSDQDAYNMARALVEGREDIGLALPAWKTISPESVCRRLPIGIHPGAARYYREIGCLSD